MTATAVEIPAVAPSGRRRGGLAALALGLGLLAAGWALLETLRAPAVFPVRTVRFAGDLARVGEPALRRAVAPWLASGVLGVDLPRMRSAVEALPWVERASVRRVWPAAVVIHIEEQQPVAAWGEDTLLNAAGERFQPEQRPAGLARLDGPEGSHAEVLQRFQALRGPLAAAGLELTALSLDPRRAWQGRLAGGTVLALGRQDIEARVARFAAAWPRLVAGREGRIPESADLRYPNGFAVRWGAAADSGEENPE